MEGLKELKQLNKQLLKAVKSKCLDCSCNSPTEVKLCPVATCPLYPFKMGIKKD